MPLRLFRACLQALSCPSKTANTAKSATGKMGGSLAVLLNTAKGPLTYTLAALAVLAVLLIWKSKHPTPCPARLHGPDFEFPSRPLKCAARNAIFLRCRLNSFREKRTVFQQIEQKFFRFRTST